MEYTNENISEKNNNKIIGISRSEENYNKYPPYKGASLKERMCRYVIQFKQHDFDLNEFIKFRDFIEISSFNSRQDIFDFEHASNNDLDIIYEALREEFYCFCANNDDLNSVNEPSKDEAHFFRKYSIAQH